MIDVGQGDCFLLELNNTNILIDTGGVLNYSEGWAYKESYNMALNKIIPYLKSRGINKLDYLILSHGDQDHLGEALNLINNFKVNKIILNSYNNNYKELEIINSKTDYINISEAELKVDNHTLKFINQAYNDENEDSLVLLINVNNKNLLFTGDIGEKAELNLLKNYNLPQIDYLKVAHHGSKTSSSLSFIEKINPQISLISVGENNRYGHPNQQVLDNLKNSVIYQTALDGSVLINLDNEKIITCRGC